MRIFRLIRAMPAFVVIAFVAALWIMALACGVMAQTTFPNPSGTAVSATTGDTGASRQVIGSNGSRKVLQICNPSASVIWWIAPAPITAAANGAGSIGLPAVSSGTTTCYTTPIFSNSVGAAWNGIPASTPATLSIYEFN